MTLAAMVGALSIGVASIQSGVGLHCQVFTKRKIPALKRLHAVLCLESCTGEISGFVLNPRGRVVCVATGMGIVNEQGEISGVTSFDCQPAA